MRTTDPRSAVGAREPLSPFAKGIRQHHTHAPLTSGTGPQPALRNRLKLDAIVVPASRTAANLDQALKLARDVGCWLVILCSGQLDAEAAKEYADARSRSHGKVIAADIPAGYSHELLDFQRLRDIGSELPRACGYYTTDLSIKRNIGLILARMLKWHKIFFLDDDIRDITYLDLQNTVDMLGPSYSAAGLRITEFPDNSIACHANRITGEKQDVFVSGAALAVNCDEWLGFFPEIYNEDWLFFFDYASQGKLATSYLEATQLEYRPFAHPQRAAWQEFGDLVAEGLYALVHLDQPIGEATRGYWRHFIEARRTFLDGIIKRAEAAQARISEGSDPPEELDIPEGLIVSVREAVDTLLTIQPELCERYVCAWRDDLADWSERLDRVAEMPSVEEALRELRLTPVASASAGKRTLPRQETFPMGIAGPVAIPLSGAMREMPELTRAATTVPVPDVDRPAAGSPDHSRRRRWRFSSWRLKVRAAFVGGTLVPESVTPSLRPGGSAELPVTPTSDAGKPVPAPAPALIGS